MTVFETLAPAQPTAQQGAHRIKRTLAQAFQQIESSLSMVQMITERHGKSEIDSALGQDKAEVLKLYNELKAVVEKNKPESKISDYA